MPRKKAPADPDAGAWRVILEDIRSQIQVFGDAVNAGLQGLRTEMIERFEKVEGRLDTVEAAVRQNSADIRQNSADIRQNSADIRQNSADIRQNSADIRQNSADIQDLTTRVEKLEQVEGRVTALEQHTR